MIKHLFVVCIALSLSFALITPAKAEENKMPQVLFINQVRGVECCSPGSLEHFKSQLGTFETNQLPVAFALRTDALSDETYVQLAKASIPQNRLVTYGLLFEVTPKLASQAGVIYKGSPENWHQAAHAFTLGYDPVDRIKLADTLVAQYRKVFGKNPTFVTAWMIDTPTANYLATKYGISLLEITREQWGTDSYTLHGGPEHYPYIPSKNWLFTPAATDVEAAPYLVVRQTISDPVFNYADFKGRFTSQPNDYMSDGKNTEYFKRLLHQSLFEQPSGQQGFALLGLENSMEKKYQDEFIKQIATVAQLKEAGKLSVVGVSELEKEWGFFQEKIYTGTNLLQKENGVTAAWITTPSYQARLVQDRGVIALEDLKLYDQKLTDPYASISAKLHAYWIQPSLLDTLRQLQITDGSYIDTGKSERSLFGKSTANDDRHRLVLSTDTNAIPLHFAKTTEGIIAKYANDAGQIIFTPSAMKVMGQAKEEIVYVPDTIDMPIHVDNNEESISLQWKNSEIESHGISINCANDVCDLSSTISAGQIENLRSAQPEWFLPESNELEIADEQTKVYVNNPYTILGELATRIVFIPKNSQGQAVSLATEPIFDLPESLVLATPSASMKTQHIQFYDLNASASGRYQITMQSGSHQYVLQLQVAPNCKNEWKSCLQAPRLAYWWVRAKIDDKWRSMQETSKN